MIKSVDELLGGWTKDRDTRKEGPTQAGILMFGRLRSIFDAVPHYLVDYRESSTTVQGEVRWIDRVTTDGTWSGNLFDFSCFLRALVVAPLIFWTQNKLHIL